MVAFPAEVLTGKALNSIILLRQVTDVQSDFISKIDIG